MTSKRDNKYWAERLRKTGRHDLLAKINSGEIKTYEATIIAKLRKKKPLNTAAALTDRWNRLSETEKHRFVIKNFSELRPLLAATIENINERRATAKDQK